MKHEAQCVVRCRTQCTVWVCPSHDPLCVSGRKKPLSRLRSHSEMLAWLVAASALMVFRRCNYAQRAAIHAKPFGFLFDLQSRELVAYVRSQMCCPQFACFVTLSHTSLYVPARLKADMFTHSVKTLISSRKDTFSHFQHLSVAVKCSA